MSTDSDNASKSAFSTRCLPGSVAEQKEKERMEEFHRSKALRKAEEIRNKPQADAQRQEKYLAACEANKQQMRRDRAVRAVYGGLPRP